MFWASGLKMAVGRGLQVQGRAACGADAQTRYTNEEKLTNTVTD